MLHEKLKTLLLEAGLSESEVSVYLELLNSPAQTKWELVGRTKLDRNKVYRSFEKLEEFKMVTADEAGFRALSLKALVSELNLSSREKGKLATKIKNVAPYLRMANESVEEFDLLYTQNQILDAYIKMSDIKYDVCLDFGDLETFVPILGGLHPVFKFRENRSRHAHNRAICTTAGPFTNCMARQKDLNAFKATLDILDLDFKDKWIIFSDSNDLVMFNDMTNKNFPCSILLRSKVIADFQRAYFCQFYQMVEKN